MKTTYRRQNRASLNENKRVKKCEMLTDGATHKNAGKFGEKYRIN